MISRLIGTLLSSTTTHFEQRQGGFETIDRLWPMYSQTVLYYFNYLAEISLPSLLILKLLTKE